MAAAGRPFQGLLYGGLMLTPDRGPMVIEWNCRFGDPETQSVLMRLDEDLLPWLAGVAAGKLPAGRAARPARGLVLRRAGGGAATRRRRAWVTSITGLPAPSDDVRVFHAGTRRDGDRLLTAGGRVLGVTARGADLAAARARAYAAIDKIHFDGMHFRRDIGLRGQRT